MYVDEIRAYTPQNEQEAADQRLILEYIRLFPDNILTRDNEIAHLSSSGFVVNADGTTTIYVFYYAGGENDDIKVDYDVNIYKVDGNGNRVLVSSNTYQGYVDTTVHGNANKQGMAEGLAGNDDWHAYDKAMAGYTYRDEGQADAGYYSANAANWFTTAQALLTASLNAAGRPTLNLYYEAFLHNLCNFLFQNFLVLESFFQTFQTLISSQSLVR